MYHFSKVACTAFFSKALCPWMLGTECFYCILPYLSQHIFEHYVYYSPHVSNSPSHLRLHLDSSSGRQATEFTSAIICPLPPTYTGPCPRFRQQTPTPHFAELLDFLTSPIGATQYGFAGSIWSVGYKLNTPTHLC